MDIVDVIEEKHTNWLNCETDELDLTIEEAKHILVNDHKQRYVDELLEESWKIVLSELEKKDEYIKMLTDERDTLIQERDYYKARYNELSKIVDSMTKHIYILGDYACLYEECDDNMDRECEDCIKEYFYKKVKETKDNGSTKNL